MPHPSCIIKSPVFQHIIFLAYTAKTANATAAPRTPAATPPLEAAPVNLAEPTPVPDGATPKVLVALVGAAGAGVAGATPARRPIELPVMVWKTTAGTVTAVEMVVVLGAIETPGGAVVHGTSMVVAIMMVVTGPEAAGLV